MMGNSHVTYKCLENAGKYGLETIQEISSYLRTEIYGNALECLHSRAFLYISVHRNARMTEMKRSGIEVMLAFADNVGSRDNVC